VGSTMCIYGSSIPSSGVALKDPEAGSWAALSS